VFSGSTLLLIVNDKNQSLISGLQLMCYTAVRVKIQGKIEFESGRKLPAFSQGVSELGDFEQKLQYSGLSLPQLDNLS
jgi:hypothetical protein